MIDEAALNIYTDGCSKPGPRRGGVGVLFIYVDASGKEVTEELPLPGYMGSTNNEMELNASILALKHALSYLERQEFQKVVIYSDSSYVVDNYKNAMFVWPRTKWMRKDGAPVLNAQLWIGLVRIIRKIGKRVEFVKVKGHSKNKYNRAADKLAKNSATNPVNKPLSIKIVRRKKSREHTRIGSVEMLGQRLTIRIIQGEYLKVQHLYRYRYEVMSKTSPYFGNVDFLCSTEVLREGHTYSVRLNDDKGNPHIMKVFGEVLPKVSLS